MINPRKNPKDVFYLGEKNIIESGEENLDFSRPSNKPKLGITRNQDMQGLNSQVPGLSWYTKSKNYFLLRAKPGYIYQINNLFLL